MNSSSKQHQKPQNTSKNSINFEYAKNVTFPPTHSHQAASTLLPKPPSRPWARQVSFARKCKLQIERATLRMKDPTQDPSVRD